MSGWSTHEGLSVALAVDNIDTDQLIPARFMSRPRAEGYGDLLLHDFRQNVESRFVLDQHPNASIMITGRNFGSGSSREAAAYALVDAGIRVVIATSFGDIFIANAINNGLLPARVSDDTLALLKRCVKQNAVLTQVSITEQSIRMGTESWPFVLDETLSQKLINGWDDIDLTMNHKASIEAYRSKRRVDQPYTWPDSLPTTRPTS